MRDQTRGLTRERRSAQDMWKAYLHSIGEDPATSDKKFTAWHFCDDEKNANDLAALVLAGHKRATAGSLWTYEMNQEPLPSEGTYAVILDWLGEAQCIIRTTAVEIVPFNEVTADFALTEGEGDKSLKYWRRVHWAYFERELRSFGKRPDETMPVVCEVFEVAYDPEGQKSRGPGNHGRSQAKTGC